VPALKAHPFFKNIDWDKLLRKELEAPYKPKLVSEEDTDKFDTEFTQVEIKEETSRLT
jgi:hypothetical protein